MKLLNLLEGKTKILLVSHIDYLYKPIFFFLIYMSNTTVNISLKVYYKHQTVIAYLRGIQTP
jgi:hypothetical protein